MLVWEVSKHVELVENDEVNFRQLGNIINNIFLYNTLHSCTSLYTHRSRDNVCIHDRRAPVTTLRSQSITAPDLQHLTILCATSICSSNTTIEITAIAGILNIARNTACPS